MVYQVLLPLMHTPRLPVVDWTEVPVNLNGMVHFTERWNLVSARVPSHFKRSLMNLPLCHLYTATNFNRFRHLLEKKVRVFMTMWRHSCSVTPVIFSHITEQLVGVKDVMLWGPHYESRVDELPQHPLYFLPTTPKPSQFHSKKIPAPVFGAHVLWFYWQLTKGRFTHSMPCPCRAHAVPLPCRVLIHKCHTAHLPCCDSAVPFVKFRVVAANIRTASPTV